MLGMSGLARRVFGNSNDRKVKAYSGKVDAINALEPEIQALSDEDLRARTDAFRQRLADGAKLDDLLVDAFATVREAAVRTLGQRHYDVQLIGGMVLHEGRIAEMKTGEGKTLVATLAVYLNALEGKGVHVVTVNDYLASRDAEWMGQVYKFLGLTVGCIVHGLTDDERREAYAADVTYGTNNEFGFDYLRDNMKYSLEAMAQRGHRFAIVDEVDSILIDEARTPLIISGPTDDNSELYRIIDGLIPKLAEEHFELDEKTRTVMLTEEGNEFVEELLSKLDEERAEKDPQAEPILQPGGMYDVANIAVVHHVNQALRAHKLFTRDKDYIVKGGKVIIIDEFTGRMMEGRRYSDGLHQALEAKENATVQPENQTLASVTFQNYFRLYDKLAGMTGTALTEAGEFDEIYKLDVVEVPTNLPVRRDDKDDEVYRTANEKYNAIIEEIEDCHRRGQPVLVGTVSIEKSETLSGLLKKHKFEIDGKKKTGIPHQVLNARYHEQEAHIIAQAGVPGAVTIATNMAGRGTDIQLGGNVEMRIGDEVPADSSEEARAKKIEEIKADIAEKKDIVRENGGLYVLGTERHESRRIDNQLRGRSGRQGDPGTSKFYLSLEDDLMRIFAPERLDGMLRTLGIQEGEAIIHPWINKALERAQQKVEARNFDIRKNLLKYDNVMNDQRKVIFEQRREFMDAEDLSEVITDMRHQSINDMVSRHIPERAYPDQWDSEGLKEEAQRTLGLDLPVPDWAKEEGIADEEIRERITSAADKRAAERAATMGLDLTRRVEKAMLLQTIDRDWREHLQMLDYMRTAVGLRGYGQRDPLNEYKSEAFSLFEHLLTRLRQEVTQQLMTIEIQTEPPADLRQAPSRPMQAIHQDPQTGENEVTEAGGTITGQPHRQPAAAGAGNPQGWGKVPRNAPCPCGSGKKYKHCHGAVSAAV